MTRYDGMESFDPPAAGVVLTIGNFDGVHIGHRALIERARKVAAPRSLPVVAMTFEPHPLAILRPESAPPRLTTIGEKAALLEQAGADALIVVASSMDLLAMSARAFFERVMSRLRPRAFVEGPSFNFGRGREGSIDSLREMGSEFGVEVHVLDEVQCDALFGSPPVNSSAVRAALADGHIEDANAMLGRPHRVVGVVTAGDGRGAGLGFPTANLEGVAQLLPSHGVYAGVAQLEDDALIPAAINIGPQPTFDQNASRVEAHLLDFDRCLRGQHLGLHLLRLLRDQMKFGSADELVAQLRADAARVREIGPLAAAPLCAIPLVF